MRNVGRCAIALLQILGLPALAQVPETPHIISEEVQRFAIEQGLATTYGLGAGASDQQLADYINTLTAIDITANERAAELGYKEPTSADYAIAAGVLCKIDWPWKPPEEVLPDYKELGIFDDAYLSSEKQKIFLDALGPVYLKASADELQTLTGVTLSQFKTDFFNIDAFR